MNILALDYGPDLINDVANQYINAINSGFGLIKGDVTWLLNVLIILSIMWSAALWALSDDHIIVQFARKIVYIGLFAWIIQNWQKLTDTLARSFMDLGLKAGGFDGATYYTQQPGNIAYLGYTTAQPLMDQISRLTGPVAFFKNFVEIAFLFLAICAIVAAFCIITIQVVVALLTFKFGSLGGLRAGAIRRPVQNGIHRGATAWMGGRLRRAADGADACTRGGKQHFPRAEGAAWADGDNLSGILHCAGGAVAHGLVAGRVPTGIGPDYRRSEPGRRHGDQYERNGAEHNGGDRRQNALGC